MGRRLAHTVYLDGPDGEPVSFGPDSTDIPKWAADLIGEHAYETDDASDDGGIPPKSGRGSGDKAWAAYAAANDVEVAAGAAKADIIAALDAAGVPTE